MLSSRAARVAGRVVDIQSFSADEIVDQASALIADRLRADIEDQGRVSLGIPGGSALAPLAGIRKQLGAHWKRVQLTWVDERCVEQASPDSNRGEAYRSGALSSEDPPLLELPLWLDNDSCEAASARVQAQLVRDFDGSLDVALLGMGPDGHIASLFPGHELLDTASKASVLVLFDSPKPPAQRITLSLRFLKKTRHSFLVALGEAKREPLMRVLRGDDKLPLSHIGNLTILTDLDLGASP